MAVARHAANQLSRRRLPGWPARGVLTVTGAKLADALTTAVALTFLPLVELNPVVRSLIAHAGVIPGVLIGSVIAIGFITLVTESGVYACRRFSPDQNDIARVRYAGYGLPTILFSAAATYNLVLILVVL